ncbi:gp16 family protein [Oceanobacter kriegii]|uniref:gp16 family protein n=1 Tax=Oceanobacter kriegii TaxID=64972 RepID=UPI00041B18FC|nr:regulatory protein GemA [Oceanobacter kriegii]
MSAMNGATAQGKAKAMIHIAKKQLGLDDETYRALLVGATGKASCADMSLNELNKVVDALKVRGFKTRPSKKNGPTSRRRVVDQNGVEHGGPTQGDKIRALWIEMANSGIVKDGSEDALRKYVKRMSKNRFEAPQFCDDATAWTVIESLKKWRTRAEKHVTQEHNACK